MRNLLFALMLAGCATASHQADEAPVTAAPVIAAERAFAARGTEIGWVAAFAEFTAHDGMIGNLGNAPQQIAETPDTGARNLFWWPAYAGISLSGDLGYTTGPFSVDEARTPRGQYFTVWRRQPDGSWKWIWDGGPGPMPNALNHGVDADIPTLPVAAEGVGSASAAVTQVRALEAAGGLVNRLAADAQVYRIGQSLAVDPRAGFAAPAGVSYQIVRAEGSAAGDLVFTLGEAAWTGDDGQARRGLFARIWQYRAEGWRIVHDQITPRGPE
jgi:ketosteroid isomerase-like protein